MVAQLTDNAVVRSHEGPGGWHVVVLECANGLANVASSHGITRVLVADMPTRGATDRSCFAATACTPEGDALVIARQAPPALLVSYDGQRPAPSNPQEDELLHLGERQRLLILSAAAFEAMPRVLARALHGPPSALLEVDPVMLLTDLFDEIGSGSGAVISRQTRTSPTARGPQ